jgi:cell division protein FtsN
MTLNLKHLFVIATLSTTLAACSTNPVTNSGSTGATSPSSSTNSGSTYTDGNSNTSDTQGSSNTEIADNTNSTVNSYEGNTTSNNGITYTEGTSNTTNYTDWSSSTNNEAQYANTAHQRGFVVQLIASISPQKANNIKTTFASEGYPAIQNTIERNGQTLHRVQIGPYTTKEEANTQLNKMRRRYKHNVYVNGAFINENK